VREQICAEAAGEGGGVGKPPGGERRPFCELFLEIPDFLCIPGKTVVSYACFSMNIFIFPLGEA